MNQQVEITVYEITLLKNLEKAYVRVFDNDPGFMIELVAYGSIDLTLVESLHPIAPPIQMWAAIHPKRGWKKILTYDDERPCPIHKKRISSFVDLHLAGDDRWSIISSDVNSIPVRMPLKRMRHLPLNLHVKPAGVINLLSHICIFKAEQVPSSYYSNQELLGDIWTIQFCEIASLFYNSFETDKALWYAPLPEGEVVNEDKVPPKEGESNH